MDRSDVSFVVDNLDIAGLFLRHFSGQKSFEYLALQAEWRLDFAKLELSRLCSFGPGSELDDCECLVRKQM
jgi:hypothetical protein